MSLPNEAAEINEAMHMAVKDYCNENKIDPITWIHLKLMIDYPKRRKGKNSGIWNGFNEYLQEYLDNLSQS